MSNRAIVAMKVLVHALCLAPAGLLVWEFFFAQEKLGADPILSITHFTGNWALWTLLACLAVTPLRRLSLKLNWLIRFRRLLGLYAFFYATLHLATYVILFANLNLSTILGDVQKRRFVMAGFFAWLILLALALTSPLWVLKKMGGKRWQLLHRAVYVAAIAGVIHYWWLVKSGVRSPLPVTLLLAVLLLARIVWSLWQRQKKQAKPRTAAPSAPTTA